MLRTKSSHITSMYDDLYHKFFFYFAEIRKSVALLSPRPKEDKSTSYLCTELGKKPLSPRYSPGFLITGLQETGVMQGKLPESIL